MREDGGRKIVEVDGAKYQSTMYLTTKLCKVYAKLQRLLLRPIGEAAAAVINSPGTGILDMEIPPDIIGRILEKLANDLDPDTFAGLVKEILSETRRGDGAPFNYDEEFQGNLLGLMKLCGKVLEHNYGDFFAVLSAAAGKAKDAMAAGGNRKNRSTQGRQASSGRSGARS